MRPTTRHPHRTPKVEKDPQQLVWDAVLEKDFQAAIIKYAESCNWLVYHTHDSRRSAEGFPDLVCIKGGTMLILELKRESGVLSEDQERWLTALEKVTRVDAYTARPHNQASVEKYLERRGAIDERA